MKRFLFLIFFIVASAWLIGCGSSPSTVSDQATVDPFVAVESAQRTAEAAQDEADFYSRQLTATAEAPIVAITQTAAEFAMQQQYAQATSQASIMTQTAAMTQTAQSWTPTVVPTSTPNLTATMGVLELSATAQVMANDVEKDSLSVERMKATNMLYAAVPYLVGFAVLVIVLIFAYVAVKRLSFVPTPIHESGKPLPMLNVIDAVVSESDRMTNGMAQLTSGYLKQLPAITAERQDAVTNRAQNTDLYSRLGKLPRGEQAKAQLPEPTVIQTGDKFPLPEWSMLNDWDGKRGVPYLTADGWEFMNLNQHKAALGMTGFGKTRFFTRPYIACTLAMGQKVIIIGKSTDYWAFEGHPNAKLLKVSKITEPAQAMRYRDLLKALVMEMNRRDDELTSSHKSTWEHAGRESTNIVLDELGNALRIMAKVKVEIANECLAWIEALVSEGRKNGFNILFTNQRATGMASILSQTGKAIFYIEPDEERSHKALSGASSLPKGYFFAKFGGASKLAGAFHPTDDDLIRFLAERVVPELEQDDWIDAQVSEQSQLPVNNDARALPAVEIGQQSAVSNQPVDEIAQMAESIRARWSPKMTLSKVSYLFDEKVYEGNSWCAKVKKVVAYLESTTTTTTENAPEIGVFEPVAG